MYMMASAVHLMVNPVHQLENTVHPSEAPDAHVHGGIYNTPVGKYSTPSGAPDLHGRICSTPKWGS